MPKAQIRAGCTVSGPFMPEPIEVLAVVPLGASLKIIGRGKKTGLTHDPVLTPEQIVTGGAFPRKVGGENRTVTAGRRPWWPRMAGLQPLSTRAFGPRLRRLTALTALATRPLIATKRSTVRCGQSVCKCHAEKFRSAIFARILTAVHTDQETDSFVRDRALRWRRASFPTGCGGGAAGARL